MDGLSDGRFKDLCILLEKLKVSVVAAGGWGSRHWFF